MKKRKIANTLRKALLEDGKMERALYEYELEEHLDYWYEGLKSDREQFVFAVTENSGDVAMVLIMPDKTIYVNEEAREKLSQFWIKAYENNINRLIPMMAENLANDIISVTGVKMVSPNQNRRWVSLRPLELKWRDDGNPSKTIRPYQLLGKGGVAGHRNRHQTAGRNSSWSKSCLDVGV